MHALDSRDRFKCLANRDGLNKAIKSSFGITEPRFDILVSGGIKKEGMHFDYRFSQDEKTAMDDFLYYDFFSYLNNKKGNLIWRVRPRVVKVDEGKFYVYSRLLIN